MRYRKKPVVVEAILWDGTEETFVNSILPFLADGHEDFSHLPNNSGHIKPGICISLDGIIIPTLEGDVKCRTGDWIIKGIKGEFYPCKPDIFEATYEEVQDVD